jgi:hypothetical protein
MSPVEKHLCDMTANEAADSGDKDGFALWRNHFVVQQ